MERVGVTEALLTREQERAERVRRYYGRWAATYGDAADDGLFARVRAREKRLVGELLALSGGESILDVGCGSGVHCVPLAARGHDVWAVDAAPEMVARVAGRVAHAEIGDVGTLDLGRTFDRILCVGVLEFVADPRRAFERLRHHLAPGGAMVVLVPCPTIAGRVYQLTKVVHGLPAALYSASRLRALGEAAGLVYTACRRPFFHNVVMVFGAPR